jgi:anti-sigma factor RsiW
MEKLWERIMDCERMEQLLPGYWAKTLNARDAEFVAAHLASCAECGELVALGEKVAQLPQEQPSPMLRARFDAMLEAYNEGRGETSRFEARAERTPIWGGWNWTRSAFAFGAMAVLLIVAGFVAGRYATSSETKSTDHSEQELTAMQSELTNMRQLVVLSMLQQESASQRLQGVSWSTKQPQSQADPKILGALMHTLRYDSSVDVRLAALDALSKYGDQTQVRTGLADALDAQQSPLVQVELIDLMVEWRDRNAIDQLKKIEEDQKVDPAVREKAHRAIDQLS